MRRFFQLLLLLMIIAGIAIAIVLNTDLRNDLEDLITQPEEDEILFLDATHTPSPNADPPPVSTTDGCEVISQAIISADAQRAQRPQTLPNGREFPGTQPTNVNIPSRPQRDQVLIQFTPGSSQQERNAYIQSIRGRSRRNIDRLDTYVVTLPPGTDMQNLPESPIVEFIEPDYILGATQAEPPNDPRYSEQWALPVVGFPAPWSRLQPDTTPITIAVIDSGICPNHPDLAGRIVSGFDFVDIDNDPQDAFGHGCGVAGIIAANLNNNEGISGIAPNARIMPLRVLDSSGLGNYSALAEAIIYATDNGAAIINISLGGPFFSQVVADAVHYAASRDVTLIAAAGNYSNEGALFPADMEAVLAVGSVDVNLERSSFSNYGADVTVYAPGRDILTTSLDGDYELMTGTSFAAPHVAAIAALNRVFGMPINTEDFIVYLYTPQEQPVCP